MHMFFRNTPTSQPDPTLAPAGIHIHLIEGRRVRLLEPSKSSHHTNKKKTGKDWLEREGVRGAARSKESSSVNSERFHLQSKLHANMYSVVRTHYKTKIELRMVHPNMR